jgi:uncharacterized membrane protein YedE/YeeE
MNLNDIYFGIIGGSFIGISAVGLMLTLGRVAGASGIIQAAIWSDDKSWRIMFIVGLMLITGLFQYLYPDYIQIRENFPLGLLAVSGLLVGIGVTFGNGCTSGHGICGISRYSKRSVIATLIFFATALVTRYVIHNIMELAP